MDQFLSKNRGTIAINGAVERLTAFADLSKKYPQAQLVFSGGSGVFFQEGLKEAHFVEPIFKKLGITGRRVHYEDQSRNTAENAKFTKELVKPTEKQNWIIITSAFHMPSALETFKAAAIQVTPAPTTA